MHKARIFHLSCRSSWAIKFYCFLVELEIRLFKQFNTQEMHFDISVSQITETLKSSSGGSEGGGALLGLKLSQFHTSFEKFGKIVGWRPLLEGWHPFLRESWIRPCQGSNKY